MSNKHLTTLKERTSYLVFIVVHWLNYEIKETLLAAFLPPAQSENVETSWVMRISESLVTLALSIIDFFIHLGYRLAYVTLKSIIMIAIFSLHITVVSAIFILLLSLKASINVLYPIVNNLVIHVIMLGLVWNTVHLAFTLLPACIDHSAASRFKQACTGLKNALYSLGLLIVYVLTRPFSSVLFGQTYLDLRGESQEEEHLQEKESSKTGWHCDLISATTILFGTLSRHVQALSDHLQTLFSVPLHIVIDLFISTGLLLCAATKICFCVPLILRPVTTRLFGMRAINKPVPTLLDLEQQFVTNNSLESTA